MHATKFAVPRHLYATAIENAELVSQVTKDAYNFIFSRCGKKIGLATIVAIGLATLVQEYESGDHRPAKEVIEEALRENHERLHSRDDRRAAIVADGIKEFGADRIEHVAGGLYAAQFEIMEPAEGTGTTLDDPRVTEETRNQYRWAALVALRADASH